jgi:hypothetical protein
MTGEDVFGLLLTTDANAFCSLYESIAECLRALTNAYVSKSNQDEREAGSRQGIKSGVGTANLRGGERREQNLAVSSTCRFFCGSGASGGGTRASFLAADRFRATLSPVMPSSGWIR